MSGTTGRVKQNQTKRLEQKERLQRLEAIEAATKQSLADNQNVVMTSLTELVKASAGWSQVNPEFQTIINRSLAGEIINLDELQSLIDDWNAANPKE